MANLTLTQKFQAILDARGLNVTGGYIGNRQLRIVGEPAAVDEARQLLGCMMTEDQVIDYDAEGALPALRIVIFTAPTIEPGTEKAVLAGAMVTANARGLA